MKQLLSFALLFFFISKFFGSDATTAVNEYHGNRRQWTILADGKMHIALHILKDPIKLLFPKEITFAELLSDLKLYSPTENEKCEDTKSLNFNLLIDDKNDIHGEIKLERTSSGIQKVAAYLFEKCNGDERTRYYAAPLIDGNSETLAITGRHCYANGSVPFQVYKKDDTKHVMELQTSGTFECQIFLELPASMKVEDIKLPEYAKIKLNETFVGYEDGFWWKNANDEMLPNEISFDSEKNVKINILNSTVSNPYFFRIGIGQPIPSFKFNFGANCELWAVFEIYLNLKSDCQLVVKLNQNGFTFSTKLDANKDIKGELSALIFGGTQVFVKVDSPLSLSESKTCQLSNPSDVPNDQFVLQIAPFENIGDCEKAELIVAQKDVINGIEVLIDRTKIVENSTLNSTEIPTVPLSTDTSAEAELEWWWYIIFGVFVCVVIVAAALIYAYVIRPCIQKRKKNKKRIIMVESIVEDEDEEKPKTVTAKTAVSPELKSAKEKTKDEKENIKVEKKKANPANDKPAKIKPPKPVPPPAPAAPIAPRKPLPPRQLKYRTMYGLDGFAKMNKPFDYHFNETSQFKETVSPAIFNTPDIRIHYNFWKCLENIVETERDCEVFADDYYPTNANVYFMVRDLVDWDGFYGPLLKLSNRMLECYDFNPRPDKPVESLKDNEGNKLYKRDQFYMLRIFILSYDPLTIEIHCRGPWPLFFFKLFDCKKCRELLKALLSNKWHDSPVTCIEDWDTFLCRVKRTPINSHQFLTYFGNVGTSEPDDPNDIHNILIIRGDRESDQIRECTRGCFFPDDFSHSTKFSLVTPLRHPPTVTK